MLNRQEERAIPGMIEPVESALLYNISINLEFKPNESVVEFGTFFGRSTNAIAQGLRHNPSLNTTNKLYAYDSFQCHVSGVFSHHVKNFARAGGVETLIDTSERDIVNFQPIFKHYLSKYIQDGIVAPIKCELHQSKAQTDSILLMHIDSPKFYDELKYILFEFFPKMKIGSDVVFQDYFYHWSATLIAAIGLLLELGHLHIVSTAASSLQCKIKKEITVSDAEKIDMMMNNADAVLTYLNTAIEKTKSIPRRHFDRPEQFFPRLTIAMAQYLHEQGKVADCSKILLGIMAHCKTSTSAVRNQCLMDINELSQYDFDIRKLYELDHNIYSQS